MRLTKFYLSCILSLAYLFVQAQSISSQVLSNAGNTVIGEGGKLSWTLGEVAVSTWKSGDAQFSLTEGFHQPVLQVSQLSPQGEQWVQIVPNPVREKLNLLAQTKGQDLYLANLLDAQGRVLIKDLKVAGKAEIDMSTYPAGVYFLSIRQFGDLPVQNHKIVKL